MKKGKIPTLIVLVMLILGVVIGVFLVRNRQIFKLGASEQTSPKDVRITNIGDLGFTVSWTTDKQTGGFIKWGNGQNSLDKTTVSETDNSNVHLATISGLLPDSAYFFKINSDSQDFDNNGVPWQAHTAPEASLPNNPIVISGVVQDASSIPVEKALVYVTAGGGTTLSTLTSKEGNWVVSLSNARTQDLSSYVSIDESKTLVEISVQAGSQGTASALIYPASAKPAPPIVLGQSHDFKNLPPSPEGEIPSATLQAPNVNRTSGFDVPESSPSSAPNSVTIKSTNEGEVVTSTEPEFFGDAPPQAKLTITIESDPVTQVITVPSSGQWQWSPPTGLPEGPHKITISWRDSGGILRTITRNFVVQAADGPAFVSTPSATPTPRATSTPTPKSTATPTPTLKPSLTPTITPKPTASISATPTPKPTKTPTSTPSSLPNAGSGAETVAYLILGLTLLAFSGLTFALSIHKNK